MTNGDLLDLIETHSRLVEEVESRTLAIHHGGNARTMELKRDALADAHRALAEFRAEPFPQA